MLRTILTVGFAALTGAGGWLVGSAYPAPPELIEKINSRTDEIRAKLKLQDVDLAGLKGLMSSEKFDELSNQMSSLAQAAGEVIVVEKDSGTLEEQLDNMALSEADIAMPSAPAAAPAAPAAAGGAAAPATPAQVFNASLSLCPRMKIDNAPVADAQSVVTGYKPVVDIKGVKIATDPTRTGCLSSGYGSRNSRLHKGVDYHSETGGAILAAGDGTIIEMKYRDDYGNMLLIDHGGGVYTRYAHLASFGQGLSQGVRVKAGEQIGLMGNTASYPVPIHLHYEVLLGDYANPKASFGLESTNVFTYKAASL